ncbi:6-bladed beta-propeller [Odoribacter sp. AF15-53]|nr:6-bladed beta-propeller [Odoribacter sp. AF15-53]RHR82828.1 6-bladed beta-propeller [Odoribacter sp. AF15-53]
MKKNHYIIILLIISCFSCKNKDTNIKCIHFDFDQNMKDIHSTGLLKDCKIIALETRDSVLIGRIDKAIVYKDRLYVATFGDDQSVFIFDLKGNFIHKINTVGRAPGEYLQLFDIFINKRNHTLNLLSRIDRKVLSYDINNLKLVEIYPIPETLYKMFSWQKGYIGYAGNYTQDENKRYNLWELDSNFQTINLSVNIDPSWLGKSSNIKSFSSYKDSLYYIAPTDFNVYRYDGKNMSTCHSVNFGKYHLPEEQISYKKYEEYCWPPNYITTIRKFQETQDYYIYLVLESGQNRLCLYNKNNQETNICELTPYTKKYLTTFGNIIDITQDYIITSVEAADICEYLKGKNEYVNFEKNYPEQIHRMREELPDINEDSNPCIVIYSIQHYSQSS